MPWSDPAERGRAEQRFGCCLQLAESSASGAGAAAEGGASLREIESPESPRSMLPRQAVGGNTHGDFRVFLLPGSAGSPFKHPFLVRLADKSRQDRLTKRTRQKFGRAVPNSISSRNCAEAISGAGDEKGRQI